MMGGPFKPSVGLSGVRKFPFFSLFPCLRAAYFAFTRADTTVREFVIKPSASGASGAIRMRFLPNGDLVCHSVPVVDLIGLAYALPANPTPRLASLPEWAVRQRFDMEAKTSAPLKLDTKDIQAQRQTIAILLQKLLKDYFGLVLKVKTVGTPIYALTLSGNDQKLTRSTISPRDCILDTGASGTGAEFANLSTLSAVLSSFGLQLHREQESLPFYVVERLAQPHAR